MNRDRTSSEAQRLALATVDRRQLLVGASALVLGCATLRNTSQETPMYGLIGRMTAQPGRRDALIEILLDGIAGMPGCLSYVVARDPEDEVTIWITEVWDAAESHAASLQLESVRNAIARARPLLAGMENVATTEPVGGHGLT